MGRVLRRLTPSAVALLLVAFGAGAGSAGDSRGRVVELERVVDGDTLKLDDGTRVRLIGIDAPEIAHDGLPGECFGKRATEFVERLLEEGEELRLVSDVETHDQYGRLLAYVYRVSDDLFVNARIIGKGFAYVDTVPPNVEHADRFRRLAREARERGDGLWDRCPPDGQQPRSLVSGRECLPDYEGACVPPPPPDLDCADVDGPITVVGDDPHRFDGDGDGRACEPKPF